MALEISLKTANAVIDAVTAFIARESGLDITRTQHILRQPFRFFVNTWISRGCELQEIRCSKEYAFSTHDDASRGEFIEVLKWVKSCTKLICAFLSGRRIFCIGARDKQWVAEFYRGQAARVDFHGGPEFLVHRSRDLRLKLQGHLVYFGFTERDAHALATSFPENLLEGCMFKIRFFGVIIPTGEDRDVCSEDLIENISSSCFVAVALEKGWKFTYKEHAVPMLIFRDHFSWDYAKIAAQIVLTENYLDFIGDEEIRKKCIYWPKKRVCHFLYDPQGPKLLCLPFIARAPWWGVAEWGNDINFVDSNTHEVRALVDRISSREHILLRHHPAQKKGSRVHSLHPQSFAGEAISEVVFVGWTQGLFECLNNRVPAQIVLPRQFMSLTESGREYVQLLEQKSLVKFPNASASESYQNPV